MRNVWILTAIIVAVAAFIGLNQVLNQQETDSVASAPAAVSELSPAAGSEPNAIPAVNSAAIPPESNPAVDQAARDVQNAAQGSDISSLDTTAEPPPSAYTESPEAQE